ncbi:MAG TPA: Hsp20/alpha crystallin family protein [Candidatus Saccharimonadales bacterium]|nr:Hsp20/alpha crystallin family protein [Candidatus Saccharimonadales bacterium]
MARGQKQNDDLLMEDELAAAFLGDDEAPAQTNDAQAAAIADESWEENDVPGQLGVDVFETKDKLVVKARTAGVNKQDLDVSISDGILTISGTLNSGEEEVEQWHLQEYYWGDFSRTIALPVQVKEEEVEAVLKDGVLTVSFYKIKQEQARKIEIQ